MYTYMYMYVLSHNGMHNANEHVHDNTWVEELAGWEQGMGCMVLVAEEGCMVLVAVVDSGPHSSLEGVEQGRGQLAWGLRQDEGSHQVEG